MTGQRTAADYQAQLQALLPPGAAWPRSPDTVLGGLLAAEAEELARIDARAIDLIGEADPATALELLGDWERNLGLPDACVPAEPSIRARQAMARQKLAARGGQSRAYFVGLAALLGFEIAIEEYAPFGAGDLAGDELFGEDWADAWFVRVKDAGAGPGGRNSSVEVAWFTAGSDAGEALRTFEITTLECVFGRARPAHSILGFAFDLAPEPTLWFDFLKGASDASY